MHIQRMSNKACRILQTVPFDIQSICSLCQNADKEKHFPFSIDNYMIIWVHHGTGEIVIDLQQFSMEPDMVYYLKPGQALCVDTKGPTEGFIISFTREFVAANEKNLSELRDTSLFNPSWSVPRLSVKKEFADPMKHIAAKMVLECESLLDFKEEALKGYLRIFLVFLNRQIGEIKQMDIQSRQVKLANIFYAMVEKHFSQKRMVRDYAEILSVSAGYLNYIVRTVSGFTARYHIQQRIILEAKRRAVFEGNTLKEIAYGLGFGDPAHFSKYFKSSSGKNFTDFKKGSYSFS